MNARSIAVGLFGRKFSSRKSHLNLAKAVCEALEQRRLLTNPVVLKSGFRHRNGSHLSDAASDAQLPL